MSRASWDERYRRGEHASGEPEELLVRAVDGVAPGRALDLACGAGRNAIFLASRGWRVTAVDHSPAAIGILRQRAGERGVTLDARVADLEAGEFVPEPDACDLICVIHYLQRDLFPHMHAALCTGGLVVAMIHMVDEVPDVPPMNPAYLLQPGELRGFFAGWRILRDAETRPPGEPKRRLTAGIVAQKTR